ncbi:MULTISPECIES: PLP-dependent aminotransferase family protein [unclassified Kitasatospora]|uniref:aminotransferase-like domain-containing protein n=1 Tax=unclassified Kitasatospora TaxID=2633591 RepID=UPI0007112053|nr:MULTISPECIES: PLP-dependent aminotransferase family protein [unclassified Kitasatospora]KQV13275.1 GntR family transcriptional regulator [Kitasatospora sp. Root107]KRB75277.1 GntR family transcriptional regulator [Kitasatospora sp. Root187]
MTTELVREELHASVSDPASASMNFLNEVSSRFPDAISLAAGRPYEGFHSTDDLHRYLRTYLDHLERLGLDADQRQRQLLQYGRTNGYLGPLIARMLAQDEGIEVPEQAVMVTTGAQEAMVVALRGLCAGPGDVVLAVEPCYVGFTGAARLLGIEVVPVPETADGLDPETVLAVARAVRADGRRPRALYLVPSFANPSGASMPVPARRRLLEVAAEADLLLLEDDPYGLFGLDEAPRPALKALDTGQRVIYLGSFAKSCFPGARIGFLVADQAVIDRQGRRTLLAEELSTVKSLLTVNTSPVAQALVGGFLVESGCSLRTAAKEKIQFYRENLRTLLATLERSFADQPRVRWNAPDGGFFAVVDVPLTADESLLEISGRDYGVLWTPMSFFHGGDGGRRALRLSCSALEPAQIEEGVRRLARLVRDRAEPR